MSKKNELTLKTVEDLNGTDYIKVLNNLELCSENDLENIMDHFIHFFDISKKNQILKKFNSSNYSSAKIILEILKHSCVSIVELYECMLKCGLMSICEILENNFPNETNSVRLQIEPNNFSLLPNTNNFNTEKNKNLIDFNNLQTNLIRNDTNQRIIQNQTQVDLTSLTTILLCEEILPVICENKQNDNQLFHQQQYNNNLSPIRNTESPKKLFGCFQVCYMDDRKLTFRKREFDNPISYVKELKMIKYKHLNLYTAECILKNTLSNNFFLLFNYDTVPTQLLTDFADNYIKLKPSQYNTLHQLEILRDISCGLAFLHEKTDIKKISVLHGNLNPDCILIEIRNEDQVSAKLFDFVNLVEVNEIENFDVKIRDEFFKFGQIIFMVATWRYLDKTECERLHYEKDGEEDLYLYELFKRFDMNKQPNPLIIQNLLKMFFKLTSSSYDITKGIQKSYNVIKDFLKKLNEKKSVVWP